MTSHTISFEIYFIIIPSTTTTSKWFLTSSATIQTLFSALLFALVSHVHPSYPLSFVNAITFDKNRPSRYEALRSALFSSPLSFLPLNPRFLPQNSLLKNHQSMFFTYCDRTSSMPTQNNRYNHIS